MSIRRALERVEALTPAKQADRQTAELMLPALRAALGEVRGGVRQVVGSLEWEDAVAPFPVHMGWGAIGHEMQRRLQVVTPLIEDAGGREAVSVFLTLLAHPHLLDAGKR